MSAHDCAVKISPNVLRYLTYNESRVPFPFSDFPEPLEPDSFSAEDRDSEVLDD